MKFGKVRPEELDHINFQLPKLYKHTERALHTSSPHQQKQLRFGATAWTTEEWKGLIIPEKTPKSQFLHYYAKSFESIELNTSHYRVPSLDHIAAWREQVDTFFKFCPKVLQYISHSKLLGTDTDRITNFCDTVSHFEDNLGICFMQLPPYFSFDRLGILARFFNQWPYEIPLAVEVRHDSFFEADHFDQLYQLCAKHHVHLVVTDVAGARSMIHLALTGPTLFVRFVGNTPHPSDNTRLDQWTDTICQLFDMGLREAYFFPHQPNNINPPLSADYVMSGMKSRNFSVNMREISWCKKDKQLTLF